MATRRTSTKVTLLKRMPHLRLTFDLMSLVLAAIFIGLLTINVHNRHVIASMQNGVPVSVGFDAPVAIPLFVAVCALGLSLAHNRRTVTTVWWVSLTMVLVGLFIWGIGLGFDTSHALQ